MGNKSGVENPQRAEEKSWAEKREALGMPAPKDGRSLRSDAREVNRPPAHGSVSQEAVRPSKRLKGIAGSRFK